MPSTSDVSWSASSNVCRESTDEREGGASENAVFLTMKKKKNIYLELADGLASPLLDPIY